MTREVLDDDLSMLEQVAALPDGPDRDMLIDQLMTMDPSNPALVLRPSQTDVVYDDETWINLVSSGRGAGKTFSGGHWVNRRAERRVCNISLVGRTVADVRDVMIQGPSGILATAKADFMPTYTPSKRKLEWPNGSVAFTYSSDAPNQLRGPQSDYTWVDELASFRLVPDDSGATIWDHVMISTRLGDRPQILVTTTPKRTAAIRDLFRQAEDPKKSVKLHKASTLANRANLSKEYLSVLFDKYAGTHLELQELWGELIGDAAGALLRSHDIGHVKAKALPERDDLRVVIGVDPSVQADRDECGIIVVAATLEKKITDRNAYVLEDLTTSDGPEVWSKIIIDTWRRYSTPESPAIVVAEGNQGSMLIPLVLHQDEPAIPVAVVKAVTSKTARAEPVVLAYRRGRLQHIDWSEGRPSWLSEATGGDLDPLEGEWTGWEPGVSRWSPGRIDADVWASTVLLVDETALRRYLPMSVIGGSTSDLPMAPHRIGRPTGTYGLGSAPWRPPR